MDLTEVFDDRYLNFSDIQLERAGADVYDILVMSGALPGDSFLDVGCGEGRLVREAARRGLRATGIDASPSMTAEARRRASIENVRIQIIDWDMRAGPAPGQFDIAASWYTSFGYFDDATCRLMLYNIRSSLRPGGILVMDLVDKDYLLPRMKEIIVHENVDRLVLDRLSYDSKTGHLHTARTYFDGRNRSAVQFSVRLLAFPELCDWLLQSGFGKVDLYNDATDRAQGRLRIRAYT